MKDLIGFLIIVGTFLFLTIVAMEYDRQNLIIDATINPSAYYLMGE